MLGDGLGQGFWSIWFQDHLWRSFQQGSLWAADTRSLAAPVGGALASVAPLADAAAAGLRAFLGPISAFHAVMLVHFALAIGGGWALGRAAGLREEGALICATVLGFSAFLLSTGLASGSPVGMAGAWTPWVVAAALRCARAPSVGAALGLVLSGVLLAVSDPQLAILALLVLPLLLVPELVDAFRARRWSGGVALGVGAALAVGLGALAMEPLLRRIDVPFALLPAGAPLFSRVVAPAGMASPAGLAVALSSLVSPAELVVGGETGRTLQSAYLGWVALGLALLVPSGRRLRWVLLSLGGVVLAMGPYALVSSRAWAPVPEEGWMALRELWPAFQRVTAPGRATGFTVVGLAVLAGMSAEALLGRLPTRLAWFGALGLSGAVLVDLAWASGLPFPLPATEVAVSEAATTLRALPVPGAVMDWPPRAATGDGEIQRTFYDQLWHRRPIWESPAPGPDPTGIATNPLVVQLELLSYGADYRSEAWGPVASLHPESGRYALVDMGYAYLVLHPEQLDPERSEAVAAWLDEALTRVSTLGDGTAIFAFSTPEDSEALGAL